MMQISATIFRYVTMLARGKGQTAFSSRRVLSFVLIVGVPLVLVGSMSINKSFHHNVAYAYAALQADPESHGVMRALAAQVKNDPDALLTLKGSEVALIFNEPGLQRVEGDTGIWQYRTRDCVLDLYIADTGKGDVMHYETRGRDKASEGFDSMASHECVASIFNGHDGVTPMTFASR